MIKVNKLNASYGIVQVLFDLSFDIANGESVALLGSNGAGKSTMLNVLSGLLKESSGTIELEGKSIGNVKSDKRVELGIIQVPEGGTVFPYLSVMENLIVGASGNDESWKNRKKTLERVIRLFPILKERAGFQARLLSGGERQMLAVARGLMAEPKLLMIDEPSIGLAPKVMLQIYDTLKSLRDEGVTILLAEQNVQAALTLCTRGYVLENGRIVISGESQYLLNSQQVKQAYLGK